MGIFSIFVMRVIAKKTLREFWERHPRSEQSLKSWYKEVEAALTQPKFRLMTLKILKTEKDYTAALKRMEEIFASTKNSKTADELELLSLLIEKYENEHYFIDLPDPIEAIKFRMEQQGLKQKDLAKVMGLKSRVSEILNKKRKLSIEMIRKLNIALHIPTDVLIKKY
jgi:HTH-type transcriptional regulator/antitoxin HigA